MPPYDRDDDPEPEREPWAAICCLDEATRNGDPCLYWGMYACEVVCANLPTRKVVRPRRVCRPVKEN
jgi:hypothetical protein